MKLLLLCCITITNAVIWKPTNNSDAKVVIYWGQNGGGGEQPLSNYCDKYSVINLAFMIMFEDGRQPSCEVPNAPDLNFANHQDLCVFFDNCPFTLNCTGTIGVDIPKCQAKGTKIVLSLGGAAGAYSFSSDAKGKAFADTVWNMFFEGKAPIRPFGDVILDGVDLDIEGWSWIGYGVFINAFTQKMSDSDREYIVSGAPQCVYPDVYMGPGADKVLTQAAARFSYAAVQFYNNYCGASSGSAFWSSYAQWDAAATAGGYQILVGLPASSGAGRGYISSGTACGLVPKLRSSYKSFGGFMLWDVSWDQRNGFYSRALRACI